MMLGPAAARRRMPGGLRPRLAAAMLIALLPIGAAAQEVRMTCQHQGKSYWVSYDPKQKLFRSGDPDAGSRFRVKRDQVDGDGVLVWVGAQMLGGERDLLAFFGNDTKWLRHFYGNGSQIMHRCQ
jgi:hypothetical protein